MKKFLKYALYVSLFAAALVPVLYFGGFLYPFIVVRVFFFRIIVSVAALLFGVNIFTGVLKPDFRILKKLATWLPLALLGWSFIASAFGISFYHSLWSSFGRMDGLISQVYLVAFFYILIFTFGKREWLWFFKAISAVSLVVVVSAILEKIGVINLTPITDTARVGGFIDNAAFLASYLTITSFLAWFCALKSRGWERWLWAIVAVADFLAILLTATRGAAVGLIAALIVGVVLLSLYRRRLRRYTVGVFIVIVFILIGGYLGRNTLQQNNLGIVSRLASISTTETDTSSRLFIWPRAFSMTLERPVFGFGVENFEYVYNKIYNPTIMVEDWFDRAHNAYVDKMVETGIPGLLLYLALFAVVGLVLKRLAKDRPYEAFIFTLLFTTYMVQNFFVFDTINTTFLFYALLAFLFTELVFAPNTEILINKNQNLIGGILVGVAVLGCVGLYWTTVLPFRANKALVESYLYQVINVPRSLRAMDYGLSLNTFADMEYGYQAYDMFFTRAAHSNGLTTFESKESYESVVDLLKGLIQKYPWNARLYVLLGHILDLRPAGEDVDQAWFVNMLKTGINLSPKRAQFYYTLANIYLKQANTFPPGSIGRQDALDQAVSILKICTELLPNYADPNLILADILQSMGKIDEAEIYFQKGLRAYKGDPFSAKHIASIYLSKKDYKGALPYLEVVAKANPNDDDAQFDLAKIYYLTGDITNAFKVLSILEDKKSPVLIKEPGVVNTIINSYRKNEGGQ